MPGPANGSRVPLRERFTEETVGELRHALANAVEAAGMSGPPAEDFVLAVHELVVNAVRHGGGTGSLMLTRRPDGVTASVSACITDSPAVIPQAPSAGSP
ncbi:ATP-binding protein [Actinoplanes sp. CA-030573]|uniref:ATP-binding protein n=1 Tax=Actinoplanes sp. CA-030573 TaxID=3239898 RepID=UPI003D92A332